MEDPTKLLVWILFFRFFPHISLFILLGAPAKTQLFSVNDFCPLPWKWDILHLHLFFPFLFPSFWHSLVLLPPPFLPLRSTSCVFFCMAMVIEHPWQNETSRRFPAPFFFPSPFHLANLPALLCHSLTVALKAACSIKLSSENCWFIAPPQVLTFALMMLPKSVPPFLCPFLKEFCTLPLPHFPSFTLRFDVLYWQWCIPPFLYQSYHALLPCLPPFFTSRANFPSFTSPPLSSFFLKLGSERLTRRV